MANPSNSPPSGRPKLWAIALGLVIAFVSTVNIVISFSGDGARPKVEIRTKPKPVIPAVIAVDNADQNAKPDDPVRLDKTAREVAADYTVHKYDLHGDLTGTIVGPVAKLEPPFAADSVPGCRTRFLTTNWSARTVPQSRVVLFWLHYSGGPDLPGTRSEVDGLTAFGNTPSARVSWHFNMDKDGNCDYNVPLRYKAWTEANANSTGISIEVAGVGSGEYLRPGGVKELRRIIAEVHKAYPAITIKLGAVSNCSPTSPGIVTHWMGGPCSGGHTDIKPQNIQDVIKVLGAGAPKLVPLTPPQMRACDLLNYHRRRAHKINKWFPSRRRRADELKRQIPSGRCLSKYRRTR